MSNEHSEQQNDALQALEESFNKLDEFVTTTTCEWCAEKGKVISEAMKLLKTTQESIYSISKKVNDINNTDKEEIDRAIESIGSLGNYAMLEPKKKLAFEQILQSCKDTHINEPFPDNLVSIEKCITNHQ